jgi:hypothetical protein
MKRHSSLKDFIDAQRHAKRREVMYVGTYASCVFMYLYVCYIAFSLANKLQQ